MTATHKFPRPTVSFDLPTSVPVVDGLALVRALRESRAGDTASVPALAVTAYGDECPADLAYLAGYQAYMRKPVDLLQLCPVVGRLAGR
jgi:CheY-like chemotaxis protein